MQSASFAVTGEVLPVPAVAGIDDGFGVEVHVVDGPAESGLRAMPTAGVPYEVTDSGHGPLRRRGRRADRARR